MFTNRFKLPFLVVILILGMVPVAAQPNYPTEPENAQLIYTDLVNFTEAYERLDQASDTIAVLNEYYFNRGSAGLNEFIARHNLTPELLKAAIEKDAEPYGKIREFISGKESFNTEFTQTMEKFKQVLPSAMFAPTYLLVGANRGIGQASKVGQLITLEKVVDRENILKKLIVHELTHFQQAMAMGPQNYAALYQSPNNMLGLCLREGGAEFVTDQVLKGITQTKGLAFYEENEEELRARFMEDVETNKPEYWLWDSIDDPEVPNLLGYVVGYKICKSYYDRAADKAKAMQQILALTQANEFLDASGYAAE